MDASDPTAGAQTEVVVDPDAVRAGRAVRARLDADAPAAGFVGEPDTPAATEFVADVVRPASR